jgi:hypothetical protein
VLLDSAFDPERAKHLNITVGVSFGATRELAFLRRNPRNYGKSSSSSPNTQDDNDDDDNHDSPCRIYFPQENNAVFTFGRDVNIRWMHGINAVPPKEQLQQQNTDNDDNNNNCLGRISIILWGLAQNVIEEEGSPPLLVC